MDRSDVQQLLNILYKFRFGKRSASTTIRDIERLFYGLRLDTENIELQCFNCGKEVHPFIDEAAMIIFDPGYDNGRISPGEPAAVYLKCKKCLEGDDHGR